MQQDYAQTPSTQPSTRSAAHNRDSRGRSLPAVPAFRLPKEGVIQGVFMVAYSEGVPTYLKSPLFKKPGDPPSRPDNYVEEDLDAKFETAGNKSQYWHTIRHIASNLIKPSQAEFARYMEQKRKQLGIADIFKIETGEPAAEDGGGLEERQPVEEGPQPKESQKPSGRRTYASAQESPDRTDPRVKKTGLVPFS